MGRTGDPLPQGWTMSKEPHSDKPEASRDYGHSLYQKPDILHPLKTVKLLVAAGADVNNVHPEYGTPSTLASRLPLMLRAHQQIIVGIDRKSENYERTIIGDWKESLFSKAGSQEFPHLRIRPEFAHWLCDRSALVER